MFRKFTKKIFFTLEFAIDFDICPTTTVNLSLIFPRTISQVFMALYIVLKIFRQIWSAYFFNFAAESIRCYHTQ